MRDLTTAELDEVSGGCWGGGCYPQPSPCQPSWNPCGGSAAQITAFAGYLAGQYDVMADIYNHADCTTVQTAISNISTDMKAGYAIGQNMTVAQADAFLNNVVSSIQSAVSWNNYGQVTQMNPIDFPPSVNFGS
ncbi:hypothetical protein WSS15_20800 [Acetobacter pasteurianus]|uniref:hypothetical protein n=1 Tax=Acetobacter pasteurianus TaxID=438 RepID=UPI000245736F|nr:hypothetical protein [Acetobacter pasteurianus]BAU38477.1 hypothetical protein APT_01395 [Acetobacter pasteurianus NBRC 101655]GLH29430.1 hypothetical protein WSS15_20800 [Acetobacter pasteurianus]CCT58375.1 hypothetical protein APA386B_256 [Acetobacter pasteurianus 386B]